MSGARNNSGGARPGAGRKPSATTIRTRKVAEKLISQNGITPLEVMTITMRALWAEAVDKDGEVTNIAQAKEATAIAEKVAPYMHPRMASIEHTGKGGAPISLQVVFGAD